MPYARRQFKRRRLVSRSRDDSANRAYRQYRRRQATSFERHTFVKPQVGNDLLPPVRWVKHTYTEVLNLTPITSFYAAYQFRANSLFDPNYTSSGHQPYGFDTLASQYNRYVVYKSAIRIQGFAQVATSGKGNWIGVYASESTTAYPFGNNLTAIEHLRNDNSCSNAKYIAGVEGTTALAEKTCTCKWDAREASATRNIDGLQEGYSAVYTTDPAQFWFFYILALEMTGAASPDNTRIMVEIDYYAKWTEPKKLSIS